MAWSLGRRDNDISIDVALAHLRTMAGCVEVPVNADFEDGFAGRCRQRGGQCRESSQDRRGGPVD